ncbi:ATP-binding protein [Aquabacterium sp. OR-4]|uniref:ATP-binding protein n=1 Tax=Aquabacterium sp. OR-4 TaxID=2978127 RepID=UPI0028CACD4A|nr:winged helix-turn-helix domain-containing protein [Aquabacterium sp. OR-4]MDT7838315.1 winged helix-turn-helix domain-containing protein [Aquabacterium sp. OR-4]
MPDPATCLRFGALTLLPAQRLATLAGEPLALGSRAFDLLLALAERRDRVVGKAELIELVWPGRVVEEANLYVHVAALRRLLGPQAICNLPGRGYRFTLVAEMAEVTEMAEAVAVASAAAAEPVVPAVTAVQVAPAAPHAPLYGREADLVQALRLAVPGGLLSITGAGGIGKSSLARHLMARLGAGLPDGAAWVDLAALASGAGLAAAVAQAAGVQLDGRGQAGAALLRAMAPLQMLLVLDNAEHLLAEVAGLASLLHQGAPGLALVVTSQAPLKLAGEQVFQLGPLPWPAGADAGVPDASARTASTASTAVDATTAATLDAALSHGAVRLLVERVRAADRHFRLDAQNLPAVVELCRRLDGLPLALELAAARVPALGLARVVAALDARFRLLSSGRRDAPARQLTLAAALGWSHALLGPAAACVFRRLGVFAGSFALEQAVAVVADDSLDEWAVVDALAELVDRALVAAVPAPENPAAPAAPGAGGAAVQAGDAAGALRYRLLETPRAFARERLAAAAEAADCQRRHALAMRQRFEQAAEAYFAGGQRIDALRCTLVPDLDDGRAAWAWAQAHDPDTAVALAADMARELDEASAQGAREVIEATQAAAAAPHCPAPLRLRWLLAAALAYGRTRPDVGAGHARQAAALADALGEPRALYRALGYLVCSPPGPALGAAERAEALARLRAIDDRGWPPILRAVRANAETFALYGDGQVEQAAHWLRQRIGLLDMAGCPDTRALVNLVVVELSLGQTDQALRTGLELERRLQGRGSPLTQFHAWRNLCAVWLARGDAAQARAVAQRGWPLAERFGLQPDWLDHLAHLCQLEDRPRCAARLLGLADALYAAHGRQRPDTEARAAEQARQCRQRLSPQAWQQALDDGARLAGDALAVAQVAGLAFARADVTGELQALPGP